MFPDGKEDPTNQCLHKDVPFNERIKQMENFTSGLLHTLGFSYWALDMIQRKWTVQQTAVFFQQNPRQAYLTLKELRNMVSEKKSQLFMTKISRYVAHIAGSSV